MHDWHSFSYETHSLYGVDMTPLSKQYEVSPLSDCFLAVHPHTHTHPHTHAPTHSHIPTPTPTLPSTQDEQREYFLLSSYWAELRGDQVVADPVAVLHLDLKTCTFEDVKGVPPTKFAFHIKADDDGDGPVRVSGAEDRT